MRRRPQESVIEAWAKPGLEVPSSSAKGVCGAYLTCVLTGVHDHRDLFPTHSEHALNDQFAPCCSRAHSPTLSN